MFTSGFTYNNIPIRHPKKNIELSYEKANVTSNQSATKISLYVLSMVFCLSCFLYQTWQLVSQYLSGRTTVENRIERLVSSRLPAITVCLPTFMDMNPFADHYLKHSENTQFREYFDEFQKFRDIVSEPGYPGWL